jgi:hypothetical protein
MTANASQTTDRDLQAELDRLTSSAYLLTLDSGKSFSSVVKAIDESIERATISSDLLGRTVEFALEETLRESRASWDGESSAFDAVLYGHSAAVNLPVLQSVKDLGSSPIVLLDSTCRIAFVLHHMLRYTISDAARKARMSERQYRTHLRRAYVQLASFGLQDVTVTNRNAEQSAPTWERNHALVEMDSCLPV